MSFEGYNQVLCKNGHLSNLDAFFEENAFKCTCGAGIAWSNLVDETNCESYGLISEKEMRKFLVSDATVCSCEHCGNKHNATEAVYRIPSWEETKLARKISQEERNA
jgi:hypothetical protein